MEVVKMAAKQKFAWTDEQIEILLDQYQKEENLWKVSLAGYSKKEVRNRCLERIATELEDNFSVAEVADKIRSIRVYYMRELAKTTTKKSGSGRDDIYISKWKYFNTLDAFLRPEVTSRKSTTNMDDLQESQDEEGGNENSDEQGPSQNTPKYNTTNKRKKVSPSQVMAEAVEVLSNYKQKSVSGNKENSDLAYAKYIALEMESISDESLKDNLKLEIQKLILNAKTTQRQSANVQGQHSIWRPHNFNNEDQLRGSATASPQQYTNL